jgi:ABC-2 type transport system permease protein
MTIFKYELRQIRGYILAWSLAVAILIIGMLPTYMGFIINGTIPVKSFGDNSFFVALGINMKYLVTPIGVYSFLTSFFMLAGAINGFFLGLNVFTKEYTMQKSADFLMTKPYNRTKIYFSKLAASVCGALFIGGAYAAGSLAAVMLNVKDGFDFRAFALIAISFTLIQFLFLSLGALVGTVFSKIRTPFTISTGIAFIAYVIGAYSRKVNNTFTKFLSPYIYFDGFGIMETGRYDAKYMIAFVALLIVFTIASYNIFIKKDVVLVS